MSHPRLEELRKMVRSSPIAIACDAMAIMADYYQEYFGVEFCVLTGPGADNWYTPRFNDELPEVRDYLRQRNEYLIAARSTGVVTVDATINGPKDFLYVEYSINDQWCRVYGPHYDSGILRPGSPICFDCPHYYHIPGDLMAIGTLATVRRSHPDMGPNTHVGRHWTKFARLNYGWTPAVSEREMEDFSQR